MPYRSPRAIRLFHWLKATVLAACGAWAVWLLWMGQPAPTPVAAEPTPVAVVAQPTAEPSPTFTPTPSPSPTNPPPTATATQPPSPTAPSPTAPSPTAPSPTAEPSPPAPTPTAEPSPSPTPSPSATASPTHTPTPATPGEIALLYPPDGAQLVGFELTMVGTAPPQAAVRIVHDGQLLGQIIADEMGVWSYVRLRVLPGQTYTLSAELVGETAVVSHTVTLNWPEIAPPCETPTPGTDLGLRYIVGTCESMIWIANRLGIDPFEFVALNPQIADPNLLRPGQLLRLPLR